MMLSLALTVLIAPPPSTCVIMAVNMTSYNAGRKNANLDSPIIRRAGTQPSNSTCTQASNIAMAGRTGDMMFINDKASFDHPGYSLCLAGMVPNYEGGLEERYYVIYSRALYFTVSLSKGLRNDRLVLHII